MCGHAGLTSDLGSYFSPSYTASAPGTLSSLLSTYTSSYPTADPVSQCGLPHCFAFLCCAHHRVTACASASNCHPRCRWALVCPRLTRHFHRLVCSASSVPPCLPAVHMAIWGVPNTRWEIPQVLRAGDPGPGRSDACGAAGADHDGDPDHGVLLRRTRRHRHQDAGRHMRAAHHHLGQGARRPPSCVNAPHDLRSDVTS